MAFHLKMSDLEKARQVAERAVKHVAWLALKANLTDLDLDRFTTLCCGLRLDFRIAKNVSTCGLLTWIWNVPTARRRPRTQFSAELQATMTPSRCASGRFFQIFFCSENWWLFGVCILCTESDQDALEPLDAILWFVLQMLRCKVHMQQARIHERNKKTQLAVKAHEACTRKFPHSKKVWIAFLTFLYQLLAWIYDSHMCIWLHLLLSNVSQCICRSWSCKECCQGMMTQRAQGKCLPRVWLHFRG